MEIELGHKNFSEMTRVEMVMMADGRGRHADGRAVASLVMEVRHLDCGKDPIVAVLGKIQGFEDGVGSVLGKIEGLEDGVGCVLGKIEGLEDYRTNQQSDIPGADCPLLAGPFQGTS
ncbi:hypothetical protein RHMOL_Rhmol04G0276300 [Rhododendron molle]|uniref:Uncharacterized protein n=1 Tax=Rhododendron molle TaxID=49168 RepID=A0ACC0P4V5_RHOML|nr:hypothetical protein RHMOL_Rhmol04G0276300 [Rhododendron molle]